MSRDRKFPGARPRELRITLRQEGEMGSNSTVEFRSNPNWLPYRSKISFVLRDIDIYVCLLHAFVAHWQKQLENLAKARRNRSDEIYSISSRAKSWEPFYMKYTNSLLLSLLSFSLFLFLLLWLFLLKISHIGILVSGTTICTNSMYKPLRV